MNAIFQVKRSKDVAVRAINVKIDGCTITQNLLQAREPKFKTVPFLKQGVHTYEVTKMAVKCLIMVVEQKFKVLGKAEKDIFHIMHSYFRSIE